MNSFECYFVSKIYLLGIYAMGIQNYHRTKLMVASKSVNDA